MRSSNTMRQKGNIDDLSSAIRTRRKKIIRYAVFTAMLILVIFLYLSADVVIDYEDIEGGITVSEHNGYYVLRADVPENTAPRGIIELLKYDEGSDIHFLSRKLCLYTSRYELWFGKRSEQVIYIISEDGRVEYVATPQQSIDRLLAEKYENDDRTYDGEQVYGEVVYCTIQKNGTALDSAGNDVILLQLKNHE